jgi:hypothetical protein
MNHPAVAANISPAPKRLTAPATNSAPVPRDYALIGCSPLTDLRAKAGGFSFALSEGRRTQSRVASAACARQLMLRGCDHVSVASVKATVTLAEVFYE